MTDTPLMPKATAVWLVDNTALTFEQIAEFCGLHVLEVKGIADGDVAHGIRGKDPIASGELTRDEIKRGQGDTSFRLTLSESKIEIPEVKTKKGPKYTPVSRRQDRPNAILWLLRLHPELKDSQIMRLVGTTKPTIQSIRERTHWNSANLQPADPVTLGLCSQTDLDRQVQRAARRVEREQKNNNQGLEKGGTLLPTEQTTASVGDQVTLVQDYKKTPDAVDSPEDLAAQLQMEQQNLKDSKPEEEKIDADSVFAKLGGGSKKEKTSEE